MTKIIEFLQKNNINYKNLDLYIQAFTHKSYSNENRNESHYEILEYLGDSLINFKTSLQLYKKYKNFDEGQATIKRSQIVDTNTLASIALKLNLNKIVRISKGANEIINNKKFNADLYEALVAAIYLDKGEKELDIFLEKTLYNLIDNNSKKTQKDPKSEFQEIVQSLTKQTGTYKVWKENDLFFAELHFDGQIYGRGKGTNKKNAETEAAKNALKIFKKGSYEVN
ncbi:ribonuclease III [Mesomycoplasma lagogenitalium]|uniref:Ribonuclease 3 n=1 Tax=Mesomycoplasma lagogenitalium TaxID=171286 RepID=A0ABY8LSW8_9BACT|nr:ribonuclease III [Mesomycoplasma lagogenitalium]WGI36350.1 ribonuclease III [Mesomycoplasma lagogenitalium]